MPAFPRPATIMLGLALATATPALAEIDAGAYLSARAALQAGDFASASPFLLNAIAGDPDNPNILESAIIAQIGRGEFERAVPLAHLMDDTGVESARAAMVLIAADVRDGNWDDILAGLEDGRSVSPLADALARSWALVGAGDVQAALVAFGTMAEVPGMRVIALQHKALALALVGDFEGADAIYSLPPGEGPMPTRQVILAHAEVLGQLDRRDEALELLQQARAQLDDPVLAALQEQLESGETVPFTEIGDAAEGMAEAWYSVASLLVNEAPDLNALFHARIALAMDPDHVDALILVAQLLERMEQYGPARSAYGQVPTDHPLHAMAELGRANILRHVGDAGAAIEVLTALLRSDPDFAPAAQRLGDALRAADRAEEAIPAYTRALDLAGEQGSARWRLLYSRAVTYFYLDDWDAAEDDFREAIDLQPDEPSLLNFYGYSLVDRNERLDEGLALIERAVTLAPDNGAYIDSLGWAFFRLGRIDEAVEQLERAATLESADPVVNDHLGDAYWMAGRYREARFQWHRALSFDPEEEDADAIRQKLETGLADAEARTADADG